MRESTSDRFVLPVPQSRDVMTEILRTGAQKMLAQMIQQEVDDWLAERSRFERRYSIPRSLVKFGLMPRHKWLLFVPKKSWPAGNKAL